MKSLKPIYWHQGLFLQPQHFQLTDLLQQALARPYLDATLPFAWGVREIDIQTSALSRGTGHINSFAAIFQDGTYVQFPGNAVIRPRSFEKDWTYRDRPLTIYAGLHRFQENASNVTVVSDLEAEGGNTRFVTLADPEEVRDLYGEGPDALVKSLYFNIRLFWDSEIQHLDHYNLIPIAQVLWDGGGHQDQSDLHSPFPVPVGLPHPRGAGPGDPERMRQPCPATRGVQVLRRRPGGVFRGGVHHLPVGPADLEPLCSPSLPVYGKRPSPPLGLLWGPAPDGRGAQHLFEQH